MMEFNTDFLKYTIISRLIGGTDVSLLWLIVLTAVSVVVPKVYRWILQHYDGMNYKYSASNKDRTNGDSSIHRTLSKYIAHLNTHSSMNYIRYTNWKHDGCSVEISIVPKLIAEIPGYDISVSLEEESRESRVDLGMTSCIEVFTFYYNDPAVLRKFIDDANLHYSIYANGFTNVKSVNLIHPSDKVSRFPFTAKSFDTLHFKQKDDLVRVLKDFKSGKSKYQTLKILMHGVPGNGKSSITAALCEELGREPFYCKLGDISNLSELLKIVNAKKFIDIESDIEFKTSPEERVLVFEDFDVGYKKVVSARDNEKVMGYTVENEDEDEASIHKPTESRLDLADILNVLDGIFTVPGLVAVFTTNLIDDIDPAFLRPGRMSININMENPNQELAEKIIRNFFPDFKGFEDSREFSVSGSTIENYCQHFDTIEEVVSQFPIRDISVYESDDIESIGMSTEEDKTQLTRLIEETANTDPQTIKNNIEQMSQKQYKQYKTYCQDVKKNTDSSQDNY